MLEQIFAVPFYKSRLNFNDYNKSDLIEDITNNYNINPIRNQWDLNSNLHHAYNDSENKNFKRLDYSRLIPLYQNHAQSFLDSYFDVNIKYEFYVVNYTCFGKGQHMEMHNHPETSFSGIHYLKFKRGEHQSTKYYNSADWASYTSSWFPKPMSNALKFSGLKHSWYHQNFSLDIEEDDIVITPSCLRHSVPFSNSDELRMAIIFHIDIVE